MTESKNFYSEAEMQEVLAELEKSIADREMLQAEKEQQQLQIQQLSLEKQELASTVQQQKKKIAKQAERIETLNESDLTLKENERLKNVNKNLEQANKRVENEKKTMALSYEKREKEYRRQLADREAAVSEKEFKLAENEMMYSERLNEEAEAKMEREIGLYQAQLEGKYQKRQEELEHEYKAKKAKADKRWRDMLKLAPKLVFCAVLCIGLICLLTFCQNHVRDKNRALQEENKKIEELLESVKTNTYKVDDDIHLYDTQKQEISAWWLPSDIYHGETFVVLENDGTWCLIHYKDEDYYIKAEDLKKAIRQIVDLS